MDKVILFGGSFNPIHKGHVEVAKTAKQDFPGAKILFVPVFSHPTKKNLISFEHHLYQYLNKQYLL